MNQRPHGLQPGALPTELHYHMESTAGFEPASNGFAIRLLEPLGHVLRIGWKDRT